MSTSAIISTDEFQALEQRVLRAVEVVKQEREARSSAESKIARLEEEIVLLQVQLAEGNEAHHAAAESAASQLRNLEQERSDVRQRVEKMLQQMDELL